MEKNISVEEEAGEEIVDEALINLHTKVIRGLVGLLEKKGFQHIRVNLDISTYSKPKSMFGHTPDITAKSAKGIFHIIDIKIKNYKKEEDYLERLKAFGKYAKLHNTIFWLFCKKGTEVHMERRIRKCELEVHVQLKQMTYQKDK